MRVTTVAEALAPATAAYRALAGLGEEVADEWQYVQDLTRVWLAELDRVAADRGVEAAPAATVAALERLADEIGRITDPHRAIDWLSTYPQAVLLALPPATAPPSGAATGPAGDAR